MLYSTWDTKDVHSGLLGTHAVFRSLVKKVAGAPLTKKRSGSRIYSGQCQEKPRTGILTNGRAWLTGVRGIRRDTYLGVPCNLQQGTSHGDVCTYKWLRHVTVSGEGAILWRVKVGASVCVVFTKFCVLRVRSSSASLSHMGLPMVQLATRFTKTLVSSGVP